MLRGWMSKRGQQALASSPGGLRACVGQTQKGTVMYWLAPSLLFIPIPSLSISNLIALVSCSKLSVLVYPGLWLNHLLLIVWLESQCTSVGAANPLLFFCVGGNHDIEMESTCLLFVFLVSSPLSSKTVVTLAASLGSVKTSSGL